MTSIINRPPKRSIAEKDGAPIELPGSRRLELPHTLRVYRDAFRDLENPNINEERLSYCIGLFDTPAGQRLFEIYSSVKAAEERRAQASCSDRVSCSDKVTAPISIPVKAPDLTKARIVAQPAHKPQLVAETDQIALHRVDEVLDHAPGDGLKSVRAFQFTRVHGTAQLAPAAQLRELMIVLTEGEAEFEFGGLEGSRRVKAGSGEVAIVHLISDLKDAVWTPSVTMTPIGGSVAGFLWVTSERGVSTKTTAGGFHHLSSSDADLSDLFWDNLERLQGVRAPIILRLSEEEPDALEWCFNDEDKTKHPHSGSLLQGDFDLGVSIRWRNIVKQVWCGRGGRCLSIALLRSDRAAGQQSQLTAHHGVEFILVLSGEMKVLLANEHGEDGSNVAFGDVERHHRRAVELSASPKAPGANKALMLASSYEHGFAAQSQKALALWIGVRKLDAVTVEDSMPGSETNDPQVGCGSPGGSN